MRCSPRRRPGSGKSREATWSIFATPLVVLRQLDLFAAPSVAFDAGFGSVRRVELAHGAWVEHHPGWVAGHDLLFEELEHGLAWKAETMRMYDRTVAVPRLLASVPPTGAGQPMIETMRRALSARYGEELVRTTAALYRDGKDSVAWHGDTTARDMVEALVATVSLGQPRRFLLKPAEGGASIAFSAGRGDLIVMGGTTQRTWRHSIPKTAHVAGPRIALMFRPAWSKDY
jgi:alkylated DNA repair dioxygenase AlkB